MAALGNSCSPTSGDATASLLMLGFVPAHAAGRPRFVTTTVKAAESPPRCNAAPDSRGTPLSALACFKNGQTNLGGKELNTTARTQDIQASCRDKVTAVQHRYPSPPSLVGGGSRSLPDPSASSVCIESSFIVLHLIFPQGKQRPPSCHRYENTSSGGHACGQEQSRFPSIRKCIFYLPAHDSIVF